MGLDIERPLEPVVVEMIDIVGGFTRLSLADDFLYITGPGVQIHRTLR